MLKHIFRAFKLLFLCFIVVYVIEVKASGFIKRCLKRNGEIGLCISINECEPIKSVLRQNFREDSQFFSSSVCPVGVGQPPFVCCANTSISSSVQNIQNDRIIFPSEKILFPSITKRTSKYGDEPAVNNKSKEKKILFPQPPNCGGITLTNKIYGGIETELTEFSWMVNLEYRTVSGSIVSVCAGSIINSIYIVTAAHCVRGKVEEKVGQIVSIRLGDHNIKTKTDCVNLKCIPPYQRVGIESIIVHEEYGNHKSLGIHNHNDIALIRVSQAINFNEFIQPVCLPNVEPTLTDLHNGMKLITAGWGHNGTVKQTDVKLKVGVPFVDREICQQFYSNKYHIAREQLCAGGVFHQDSCTGDSGGPLMRLSNQSNVWILEGIVSYGHKCGLEFPGVYTEVRSYLEWIKDNIQFIY